MQDVTYRGITSEELEASREIFLEMIEKALHATDSYLDYTPEDVLTMIDEKDMQAWGVIDGDEWIAMIVSQILVYPRRKVLEIFLASGERLRDWQHGVYDVMLVFGKTLGCTGLRWCGRPGWTKVYSGKSGMTHTAVVSIEI